MDKPTALFCLAQICLFIVPMCSLVLGGLFMGTVVATLGPCGPALVMLGVPALSFGVGLVLARLADAVA